VGRKYLPNFQIPTVSQLPLASASGSKKSIGMKKEDEKLLSPDSQIFYKPLAEASGKRSLDLKTMQRSSASPNSISLRLPLVASA
jgi:hypothetical protein